MPRPYEATFASVAAYWAMHLTMFAAAVWLWSCLLRHGNVVPGLFASTLSATQMGFLGALITLSPRAFYAPHFLTTDAWGLSPLQDQQLGGVIMWVVGCTAFFVVAMWGAARSLSHKPELLPKFRGLPITRIQSHVQP
jgi:putative membrane protein